MSLRSYSVGIMAVLCVGGSVRASTVAYDAAASAVGVSSIPTGSIGNLGYELFNTNAGNVTSGAAAGGFASVSTDSNRSQTESLMITAGATTYTSGVEYQYPEPGGSYYTVATVTLTGTVPNSFILSVYTDNAATGNAAGQDTGLQITTTGVGNNSVIQAESGTTTSSNDFYSFLITNANAGEKIAIAAAPPASAGANGTALIGGVAFNAVPEPSSVAVLGLAGLGLLHRRRRISA